MTINIVRDPSLAQISKQDSNGPYIDGAYEMNDVNQGRKKHIQPEQKPIKAGIYYVIPAQIFEDDRLEAQEVLFYAYMSGISWSEGYCYAGNKHFSEKMRVDERTIKRWLDKLEKIGYVKRVVEKKGMYWDRKIFITHSRVDSKNACEGTPVSPSKGHPCHLGSDTHVTIVSKGLVSKDPPPPSSKQKEVDPPTKEEEEEIQRRKKGRAKNLEPIKCPERWEAATLKSIRAEKKVRATEEILVDERKKLASRCDGMRVDGWFISAGREAVDFTQGAHFKAFRYDLSPKEWEKAARVLENAFKLGQGSPKTT